MNYSFCSCLSSLSEQLWSNSDSKSIFMRRVASIENIGSYRTIQSNAFSALCISTCLMHEWRLLKDFSASKSRSFSEINWIIIILCLYMHENFKKKLISLKLGAVDIIRPHYINSRTKFEPLFVSISWYCIVAFKIIYLEPSSFGSIDAFTRFLLVCIERKQILYSNNQRFMKIMVSRITRRTRASRHSR